MSLQRVIALPAVAGCLMLSGLSPAHGAEATRDPPARWLTDSAITVAVTTRLAAEHFSQVTRLKVKTDKGGVVSLGGTTPSQREAAKAAAIARKIGGVLRVNNHIEVRADAH